MSFPDAGVTLLVKNTSKDTVKIANIILTPLESDYAHFTDVNQVRYFMQLQAKNMVMTTGSFPQSVLDLLNLSGGGGTITPPAPVTPGQEFVYRDEYTTYQTQVTGYFGTTNANVTTNANNIGTLFNLPLFPSSYAIPLQGLTIGNFTLPPNPVVLGTITLG